MTVIAIDGPSGSGKSTIARLLAERLDLPFLDTGAMYRSVGIVAIARGIAFTDGESLAKLAAEIEMDVRDDRDEDGKIQQKVIVEGADATSEIRTPEASQAASAIAVHHDVRDCLVGRQRDWVIQRGGAVVEGRDIGTVVFPNADLKVFLTAHHEERVRRRHTDDSATGFDELTKAELAREIAVRDARDSQRDASPLEVAEGSFVVDTSDKTIEEVVSAVLAELANVSAGAQE